MNCDRYVLIALGIVFYIPITANITYSQELPKIVQGNKENIKINRELNLNRQVKPFNLPTVDQLKQNAIAKSNHPEYKQPQEVPKGDARISISAAHIQNASYLSNQSGLFGNPQLDQSQLKFELATKPVIRKFDRDLFPDSAIKFPPINDLINNFIIADKNHSSQPGKWSGARPDGHAPIGVMGEHTYRKGEFIFSYRYMFMNMNGNRNGTDSITHSQVLEQFMVTPTKMIIYMHPRVISRLVG